MKRILKAIARALIAIPVLTWTVCAATGRMILSAVLPPQPELTTAAGAEADEAIEAARESKPIAPVRSEVRSQAEIAYTYAAAVVTGSRPPSLDRQPVAFKRWLEDLTMAGAQTLFTTPVSAIERHLHPRCPADHLAGVASIGARPLAAAPVGQGSKKAVELEAFENAPRVTMSAEGDFVIDHDDQSRRLRAA